jgi:hypothetical protein
MAEPFSTRGLRLNPRIIVEWATLIEMVRRRRVMVDFEVVGEVGLGHSRLAMYGYCIIET